MTQPTGLAAVTILMTDRAPVRVSALAWPIVAHGQDADRARGGDLQADSSEEQGFFPSRPSICTSGSTPTGGRSCTGCICADSRGSAGQS